MTSTAAGTTPGATAGLTAQATTAGAAPAQGGRGSIEITGLRKRFGDFTAVDHLDLSVRAGEFICLLGPSGCGKTTTLRMLAGFEFPDAGKIVLSGTELGDAPPHRRDVNTVFQAYALFPHMSVAENVAFGLRQHRTSRAEVSRRVGEALEMVRMLPMATRRPAQLSGGQQQRVALARALVNRPSVLLLDEPLAALDRKLREEMQIELKLMQRDLGMTFVFVTHDQGEALSMSDRVAVMRDGRIEQLADPFTIYDSPDSAFVAGFIGQQNFFPGTLDAVDGAAAPSWDVVTPDGAFRARRSPHEGLTRGADVLVAVRPELVTLTEEDPSAAGPSSSPPSASQSSSAPHPPGLNTVSGSLASVAHLGDVLQYVVRVSGHEVIVRSPRTSAARPQPGTRVRLTFSPEDTFLFDARHHDSPGGRQ